MAAKKPATVEEYLAGVPEPARTTLRKVRRAIRSALPAGATERIAYGMPVFDYRGPVMGYAAFRQHCSLFPMSGSFLRRFERELAGYELSKGTIRFPLDRPMPAALIRRLVAARVACNESPGKR